MIRPAPSREADEDPEQADGTVADLARLTEDRPFRRQTRPVSLQPIGLQSFGTVVRKGGPL